MKSAPVDIMPTDDKILGFAKKTEAFRDRGKNDFQGSKDFEDIITVVDGRSTIREDLNKFPDDIRKFLHASIAEWKLFFVMRENMGFETRLARSDSEAPACGPRS